MLLRGIDPLDGLDTMKSLRGVKRSDKGQGLKKKELGNGPAKMTMALAINKENGNQKDLTTCDYMWMEEGETVASENVVVSSRIGIDYAEEWTKKPLRWYIHGNSSVSVRDKAAEATLQSRNHVRLIIACLMYKV